MIEVPITEVARGHLQRVGFRMHAVTLIFCATSAVPKGKIVSIDGKDYRIHDWARAQQGASLPGGIATGEVLGLRLLSYFPLLKDAKTVSFEPETP